MRHPHTHPPTPTHPPTHTPSPGTGFDQKIENFKKLCGAPKKYLTRKSAYLEVLRPKKKFFFSRYEKMTTFLRVGIQPKISFFDHFYLVKHGTCGMLPSTGKCIEKPKKTRFLLGAVSGRAKRARERQVGQGASVRSCSRFKTKKNK